MFLSYSSVDLRSGNAIDRSILFPVQEKFRIEMGMGRETDVKAEGKTRHKATKLKKLSDHESAGAQGDVIENK